MYYSSISIKSNKLFDYLTDLPYDTYNWTEHFGFDSVQLGLEWLEDEYALKAIHNIHPIKQMGVLKIPPFVNYNWHVDEFRQSCINMLISYDHISYCLFGKELNDYVTAITELKYKPYTYYLLNNQQLHTVINFDKPRYMFSLYFEEELEYKKLKQKLHPILI
jgi:hypothetical protein